MERRRRKSRFSKVWRARRPVMERSDKKRKRKEGERGMNREKARGRERDREEEEKEALRRHCRGWGERKGWKANVKRRTGHHQQKQNSTQVARPGSTSGTTRHTEHQAISRDGARHSGENGHQVEGEPSGDQVRKPQQRTGIAALQHTLPLRKVGCPGLS